MGATAAWARKIPSRVAGKSRPRSAEDRTWESFKQVIFTAERAKGAEEFLTSPKVAQSGGDEDSAGLCREPKNSVAQLDVPIRQI